MVLERLRQGADVADAGRRDVDRRPVAGGEVRGPAPDQGEAPLVKLGERSAERRGRAGVVIDVVVGAGAPVDGEIVLAERERHDPAPLRRHELVNPVGQVARLIDEQAKAHRLPAVRIEQIGVA